MDTIQLKCYFTREKLIGWLVTEKDNPFNEDDYNGIPIDDDTLIKEAFDYGYIRGVNKKKYYCFDNGNIIEHKRIGDFTNN